MKAREKKTKKRLAKHRKKSQKRRNEKERDGNKETEISSTVKYKTDLKRLKGEEGAIRKSKDERADGVGWWDGRTDGVGW